MDVGINNSLPNGVEIQFTNVMSRVILQLKIVKSVECGREEGDYEGDDDNNDVAEGGKGTCILIELTTPWHDTSHLIMANTYFASVKVALVMKGKGLFY